MELFWCIVVGLVVDQRRSSSLEGGRAGGQRRDVTHRLDMGGPVAAYRSCIVIQHCPSVVILYRQRRE
jgi:hypothetical protein